MKQGRMILLDPDKEYGRRLAEYLNSSDWIPFKVEIFSDSECMEAYIKTAVPDFLVVNECLLKEEFRKFPLLVLCETLMIAEMDSPQIYKYQSGQEIGREILSWYAMQEKRQTLVARQEKLETVGVYSLDKKREKALLAWELAKYYAKSGKTLYVSLEPYSAMAQYFGGFSGEGLSDYLFFLRQNCGNGGLRLRSVTEQVAGVDVVPPARAWEDICDVQQEEWNRLIEVAEKETEYRYLVFDISETVGDAAFWLEHCSHVFWLAGEDSYSRMRWKEMQEFLERRVERDLMAKGTLCPAGSWTAFREYEAGVQPEMEKRIAQLLKEGQTA
jgi:hypothetical protein